ncbi:MAG: hexosaminidase [Chlamydiales bacterium]|jgi:hexosaminidase
MAAFELLVPSPRVLRRTDGDWCRTAQAPLKVSFAGSDDRRAALLLERALEPRTVLEVGPGEPAQVQFQVQAGCGSFGSQGYRLVVAPDGVQIQACTARGAFYGACTLAQLLAQPPGAPEATGSAEVRVPGLEIEDTPDFERRGVMLDVSRDRVPRMDTLFALIERFARWKLNEVQLYMEHTYAYSGHENVWKDASPFLPEELRELTRFCKERFIDLVPNQQSLGHFHRWLIHDEYSALAECPDGVQHPFSRSLEPFSLAPTAPASLAFVRELHSDLLRNFESEFLNVGLDETFDIGQGASRDAVAEHGKGRVYLDYLTEINRSVAARGLRMQFWGDVILEHPELVAELPRDAVALEWGYEADHPFEQHAQRFAQAGLDFYVCPGTSSWQSFSGRLDNATRNLELAARAGRSAGACGYLITDWGDFGHWQPAPVSYAPFIAGASRAWNAEAAPPDLAQALDQHVFGRVPGSHSAGALWTAMGDLYLASGARSTNASPLFFMVRFADEDWPFERVEGWTQAGVQRTAARIAELRGDLERVGMTCADAPLVASEARWVLAALDLACDLGEAHLDLGAGVPLSSLDRSARVRMGDKLRALCSDLRPIWLERSRPGGLADSLARFEPLTHLLAAR